MATKKKLANIASQAARQQAAVAAGAVRLAEVTTLDERVSVLLAMRKQLSTDKAPKAERDRMMNIVWDLLLPEVSGYVREARGRVIPAVEFASDSERVRNAVSQLLGAN